ncbi:MAG: hypothetical protein GYB67_01925 [Chloroflexi bacterium]|nr:hypothetical protein [Chloroflexota bacterium]
MSNAGDMIIAVFPSRSTLSKALDHLMEQVDLDIQRAAVVAKAVTGEVVFLGDDIGPDEGGIAGGTLGAVVSMLGLAQLGALALPGIGPVIALGAGALIGGLAGGLTGRWAAHVVGEVIHNGEYIELLAQRLQAGHPALIVEVKDIKAALPRLREELMPYRVELVAQLGAVA